MRINALLRETGESNAALGEAIGVSGETVRRWRKGDQPKADELVRLADHFGVGVEYLLGRSDDREATGPAPLTRDEWDLLRLVRAIGTVRATEVLTVERLVPRSDEIQIDVTPTRARKKGKAGSGG